MDIQRTADGVMFTTERAQRVSPSLPLHHAAQKGNIRKVKECLKRDPSIINTVDPEFSRTPLIWCLLGGGQISVLKYLLEKGADVSIRDSGGFYSVYVAAQTGNVLAVEALLANKADVNAACSGDGATATMIAVFHNYQEVVKVLIQHGADLSKVANEGRTALSIAAGQGRYDLLLLLLQHGANINQTGCTKPLIQASQSGCYEIVTKLLERGARVDIDHSDGTNALHTSSAEGHERVIDKLILAGSTSLSKAEFTKFLNKTSDSVAPPILYAIQGGHSKCVKNLLCAGADATVIAFDGSTLLHSAVRCNHADIAEMLILAGASSQVELLNEFGYTALAMASSKNNRELVEILLNAGGDANQCDERGNTALYFTTDVGTARILLERGASATIIDKLGNNLLHQAGAYGYSGTLISMLYKAGADPLLKTNEGRTPADCARRSNHEQTAKFLDALAAQKLLQSPIREHEKENTLSVQTSCEVENVHSLVEGKSSSEVMQEEPQSPVCEQEKENKLCVRKIEETSSKVEDVHSIVRVECKSSSEEQLEHACYDCASMTSKRCSRCGEGYYCNRQCEISAWHLCCPHWNC